MTFEAVAHLVVELLPDGPLPLQLGHLLAAHSVRDERPRRQRIRRKGKNNKAGLLVAVTVEHVLLVVVRRFLVLPVRLVVCLREEPGDPAACLHDGNLGCCGLAFPFSIKSQVVR